MQTLAILGAGSWGTALAVVLAPRFPSVRLWVHSPELASTLETTRENNIYLPGFPIPSNVIVTPSLASAVSGASVILCVVPSRYVRETFSLLAPFATPDAITVSATKGLEANTLLRMSQVIGEFVPGPVAVLSGPTFALEIARGEPAAVVIASSSQETATAIQSSFSGPTLRLYTNTDVLGVEIAAALKNVIAIGAGVCQGLGLGSNTRAALITRGLAEITRLAVAMGAKATTLAGLAGLGDLVLTCTGDLSRNRQIGIELAAGRSIAAITANMRMVAEGIQTTYSAITLARKFQVKLPITEQMENLLEGRLAPSEAIRELMDRSLKGE